jgi:LPS-assembly lipoprotein
MPLRSAPSSFPTDAGILAGRGLRFWRMAAGLLLTGLSLSACGWHLRGAEPLPASMAATFVESADMQSDFDRALRRSLDASGARLVATRTDAEVVLKIRKDSTGRRVLAVSAFNTPQEYEVFYIVEYSVDVGGKEVIPLQSLELVNDYRYDEAAILAKEREEAGLRAALARDLAGLVLRRLASL